MRNSDGEENRWFREHERKMLEDVRREQEQRLKAYRQETEKESETDYDRCTG
ncbi:MAG: hypothetical protein HKP12_12990 [Gammaproteobacteria bacterium]|nr:hypothetical protein [Gammaproteobacteria bacterium]NNJ98063.1 hypothetical protein [Gammaproteobacteria bacterium]